MNGATKNVSFENSITNSNLIENEERKFRRKLGLLDLFMIGITGVIGSGWLFSPLYAANAAGPASIASWVLGGALVLMVGLVFSQLMRFKSEAGG
ncbi:TVG0227715 [Thermoplasma volcanium GSS1]|uniref:TVG0227715 protein n=1 Tax=Thermoplasma volcanium (strain ATCC 51530 / DSM 4299 / JCM 9571 / NBRC 15438 / GSS1) TaxID=273116 RepID=Q97C84_THEVO|nr:APC family permease [Thermoplasma volcanium]BAB59361.1 TVG0227715 [Thermoplasma volcanium GSS1]